MTDSIYSILSTEDVGARMAGLYDGEQIKHRATQGDLVSMAVEETLRRMGLDGESEPNKQ